MGNASMQPPPPGEFAFRLKAFSEADAGRVVLTFALIDMDLERLLLHYLPSNLSDEGAVMIFKHRGPLGSFFSKMTYALAMGLIDRNVYDELAGIRRVRNKFAHPRGYLGFEDKEIEKLFQEIKWPSEGDRRAVFEEHIRDVTRALSEKVDALIWQKVKK